MMRVEFSGGRWTGMFLANTTYGTDLHELDFRFDLISAREEFVFIHHGLNLADLADTLDLTQLGCVFAMIEARAPRSLSEFISDPLHFRTLYGVEPALLHFVYLEARSLNLLRWLISESIVGFFQHVCSRKYAPIPKSMLDLIISDYHTTSLVCLPTKWDEKYMDVVQGDVKVKLDAVQAIVVTSESYWTAYQQNFTQELLSRKFLISYHFPTKKWSLDTRSTAQ